MNLDEEAVKRLAAHREPIVKRYERVLLERDKEERKKSLRRYRASKEEMVKALSLLENGGPCQICGKLGKPFVDFAIDHCHKLGTYRGILCRNCNSGIGFLKDEPSILEAAIKYIRQHYNG